MARDIEELDGDRVAISQEYAQKLLMKNCKTCSGHGLVGGMTIEGGEGWPCPECNNPDEGKCHE